MTGSLKSRYSGKKAKKSKKSRFSTKYIIPKLFPCKQVIKDTLEIYKRDFVNNNLPYIDKDGNEFDFTEYVNFEGFKDKEVLDFMINVDFGRSGLYASANGSYLYKPKNVSVDQWLDCIDKVAREYFRIDDHKLEDPRQQHVHGHVTYLTPLPPSDLQLPLTYAGRI